MAGFKVVVRSKSTVPGRAPATDVSARVSARRWPRAGWKEYRSTPEGARTPSSGKEERRRGGLHAPGPHRAGLRSPRPARPPCCRPASCASCTRRSTAITSALLYGRALGREVHQVRGANSMLATRISFMNEAGQPADGGGQRRYRTRAHSASTTDPRIGYSFLLRGAGLRRLTSPRGRDAGADEYRGIDHPPYAEAMQRADGGGGRQRQPEAR